MKKLVLLTAFIGLLYSCSPHRCPTYSDSGAKWKKHPGHPYGGKHHH